MPNAHPTPILNASLAGAVSADPPRARARTRSSRGRCRRGLCHCRAARRRGPHRSGPLARTPRSMPGGAVAAGQRTDEPGHLVHRPGGGWAFHYPLRPICRTRRAFTSPMNASWPANTSRSTRPARCTPIASSRCRTSNIALMVATEFAVRVLRATVNSKHELDVADAVFVRIGLHFKSEIPAHLHHHGIFLKDVSRDHLEPL